MNNNNINNNRVRLASEHNIQSKRKNNNNCDGILKLFPNFSVNEEN